MPANVPESPDSAALQQSAAPAADRRSTAVAPQRFTLPVIGRLAAARQIQILGAVLLILLAGIATLMVLDRRQSAHAAAYSSMANEMQMLSQRIASTAQQAVDGMPTSFAELNAAREQFAQALKLLIDGGEHAGTKLPASPEPILSALFKLKDEWQSTDRNVGLILAARETLSRLRSDAPSDPIAAPEAHKAAGEISRAAESLLANARQISATFRGLDLTQNGVILGAVALSAFALVCLLLIGRIVIDDAEQRAFESQQSAAANERANQKTQDAILRLLDEMGNLAQGDLTVRANIGDEVTGAIADSVNFAVDELRRLVAGINDATTQVASASGQAQMITTELLAAAQRQSREITETSSAVSGITVSITQVSERAEQSAQVASQSLAAASQGSSAVRRAIEGMDAIREQIQETAKRIKRLGESSQEIGEIVDLITDITDQTNVLALNAAIQATSAGSTGRGFSMVAEEVQRLAERSAAATKQIGAIVKTIQADTQDAISAMERSTQGVVEQAGLADNADQALSRIDEVSRQLATLISDISAATKEQTASAAKISNTMHDILHITELTTEGTRRTADSTARLAAMAAQLKQSVAGFKLS